MKGFEACIVSVLGTHLWNSIRKGGGLFWKKRTACVLYFSWSASKLL